MTPDSVITLNDIHSQLNVTRVARVERPETLEGLQRSVISVAETGGSLSVMGGRHAMGGSYFLTYNRFATREQLAHCYPQFGRFLDLKGKYDPEGVFSSDWHRAYCDVG